MNWNWDWLVASTCGSLAEASRSDITQPDPSDLGAAALMLTALSPCEEVVNNIPSLSELTPGRERTAVPP